MGIPVVLHANHYQFAAAQAVENPCVGSRMLLWCRQGGGEVEVDGQRRRLEADAWLLLPWRHRVRYRADRGRPFLVGGVHLCPDHAADAPIRLEVPHAAEHPLHREAARRDARLPGLDGLAGGSFADHPRLRQLAEYIVEVFAAGAADVAAACAMGGLLWRELGAAAAAPSGRQLPVPIIAAQGAVRRDLAGRHSLASLAAVAGVSQPTLVRLFRRHLHAAPVAWLRAERLEAARRLLATTSLPVAEIGRRVGIADPQRMSRLFSAAHGQGPRAWRSRFRL